jgi:AcrR family transcriptional regulator
MSKKRTYRGETKHIILEKAAKLFTSKGYNSVSMNEICQLAEISKGSLYHHFQSKEDLFLQVIEEDARQWQEKWEGDMRTEQSNKERLYRLAEQYAADFQSPLSTALEEFARSQVISEAMLARIMSINETTMQACRSVLREGMEQGEFKAGNLEELVLIVGSMLEGLGKMYYMNNGEDSKRIYRQAIQLLLDGLSVN